MWLNWHDEIHFVLVEQNFLGSLRAEKSIDWINNITEYQKIECWMALKMSVLHSLGNKMDEYIGSFHKDISKVETRY